MIAILHVAWWKYFYQNPAADLGNHDLAKPWSMREEGTSAWRRHHIFRVTGPLWGESAGHWWIPLKKASDAEFDVFCDVCLNKLLSKKIKMPVNWDAIALIMTSL